MQHQVISVRLFYEIRSRFYLDTFQDKYPKNRKAIIPFLL
jgi:3-oxo-5-alpha-steroid 4-dehydrogenase